VTARVFAILLALCLGLAGPGAARAGVLSHTAPEWKAIGRGLSFTRVEVRQDEDVVTTLAVVKVDPALNAFRVYHASPKNIAAWQQELKAPVVFNGSFYQHDSAPCGLVVSDGKLIGPTHNSQMRGMFVSEPKGVSPDLPRATILDLLAAPLNPRQLPWTQGVQSYPLLLDHKGTIRVLRSGKKANRTVIAADRSGNILIFNCASRFFTLYDLAQFLKNSAFDIDSALNLDGGTEAQLLVKTKDFDYFTPSWESSIGTLIDQERYSLPTVIGVFPRQE
jgi:uncharacterized protein YigE (DUF2233 family)